MGLQNIKSNRIGIDMRMAGTGEGIGRYVEELVEHLFEADDKNEYVLIVNGKQNIPPRLKIKDKRLKIAAVSSPYYSFAEQTRFVSELNRLNLDLVHFPSFNAPIFYRGKFVVTIHDLIHHRFPGKKKSRALHRLAYRAVMRSSIRRAKKIMTVSQATKDDLQRLYYEPEQRFAVIYEGVDERFRKKIDTDAIQEIKIKHGITKPYILFVGVWRQYKNLPRLSSAFAQLRAKHNLDLQLVLAGKIDSFYPEIKQAVFSADFSKDIKAPGYVSDEELAALYQGAEVFALPSLVEGFGLIGAEAQASGVPVAASDIPVLREVLGEAAVFFDPKNTDDMAGKIKQVIEDKELAQRLTSAGLENSERFDWKKTAQQTFKVYNEVLNG